MLLPKPDRGGWRICLFADSVVVRAWTTSGLTIDGA